MVNEIIRQKPPVGAASVCASSFFLEAHWWRPGECIERRVPAVDRDGRIQTCKPGEKRQVLHVIVESGSEDDRVAPAQRIAGPGNSAGQTIVKSTAGFNYFGRKRKTFLRTILPNDTFPIWEVLFSRMLVGFEELHDGRRCPGRIEMTAGVDARTTGV